MGKAIVVLTPDDCRKKDVQRRNFGPPVNLVTFLEPFAVLEAG